MQNSINPNTMLTCFDVYNDVSYAHSANPVRYQQMVDTNKTYRFTTLIDVITKTGLVSHVPLKMFVKGKAVIEFSEIEELIDLNPGDSVALEMQFVKYEAGGMFTGGTMYFKDCKLLEVLSEHAAVEVKSDGTSK